MLDYLQLPNLTQNLENKIALGTGSLAPFTAPAYLFNLMELGNTPNVQPCSIYTWDISLSN